MTAVTIDQILATQRTLDQMKKDFAASLRPTLARLGYDLAPANSNAGHRVETLAYGNSSSGKTTLVGSFPKPLLVIKQAKRRILKCPRCIRRFRFPHHLGRHTAATHGAKRSR